MKISKRLVATIAISLGMAAHATVIQPVSVVSEEHTQAGLGTTVNTIDNSGMGVSVIGGDTLAVALAAEHAYNGSIAQSYFSTNSAGFPGDFFSVVTNVHLVYDLTGSGDTALGSAIFWNGGLSGAEGLQLRTAEIRINTEAEGDTTFSGTPILVTLKPVADGDGDAMNDLGGINSAQFFSLGSQSGRYVQVTLTDNYNDLQDTGADSGDRVSFGELRFATETTDTGLPPAISSFTSSASSVTNGGTITLSWATTDADTLTLDPGGIDVTGQTSNQVVVTAETTYTLTASNTFGSVDASVLVTIKEVIPGLVIQPTTLVSEDGEWIRSATLTIDNAGMTPAVNGGDALTDAMTATHAYDTALATSYLSGNPDGFPGDFFNAITQVDLVYDLTGDEDTALDGVVLWQGAYSLAPGNQLRTAEVRINTDAEGDTTFNGSAVMIALKPVDDGDGVATNDLGGINSAQFFDLGPQNGRYVQIRLTDNFAGLQGNAYTNTVAGGDRVTLGEVRFLSGSTITLPIGFITITGPVAVGGGQSMILAWDDTGNGQSYDVQAKENLITDPWTTITNVTGTGGGTTVTTAVDNVENFYRVITP